MPKVIGILQPGYLPWLGFFEQMLQSDVFVIYDDVQFDKHGWRNRNRIKGPKGPVWLTVPVRTTGKGWLANNQVEIDSTKPKWPAKHLGTVRQYYANSPYFDDYFGALEGVLSQRWEKLLDLDMALIRLLADWLAVDCDLVLSSNLKVSNSDPTARLVDIITLTGGEVFYEGASGRNYLDLEQFSKAGIEVVFQDYRPAPYPQLYGDFAPSLSAIDALFNCGPESARLVPGLPESEAGEHSNNNLEIG